ncbi:MAG: carbon storage regulator [Thermoguttaceae bacterium]
MLVLSRRKNQSIVINDDIIIIVLEIRGDRVRLGVEAAGPITREHKAAPGDGPGD